jgi:hypothetical protein
MVSRHKESLDSQTTKIGWFGKDHPLYGYDYGSRNGVGGSFDSMEGIPILDDEGIQGDPSQDEYADEVSIRGCWIGMSKITAVMGFRTPYPLIGSLIDRFYVPKEAQKLVNSALEGVKKYADQHRIPLERLQFEKRKIDHLGYEPPQIPA